MLTPRLATCAAAVAAMLMVATIIDAAAAGRARPTDGVSHLGGPRTKVKKAKVVERGAKSKPKIAADKPKPDRGNPKDHIGNRTPKRPHQRPDDKVATKPTPDKPSRPGIAKIPPVIGSIGKQPLPPKRPRQRPDQDSPPGSIAKRPDDSRPQRPIATAPIPPPGTGVALVPPVRRVAPMAVLPLAGSRPPVVTGRDAPPPAFTPPSTSPSSPPAGAAPPVLSAQAVFVPDEVLITLPGAAAQSVEADVAQAFNITLLERIPLPLIDARLVRLRIPDARTVPAVVAALGGDARVPAAQPNFVYRHNGDPQAAMQPTSTAAAAAMVTMQYALAKLGAIEAQRVSRGRGARIAVIDSGVDATHPDLAAASIEHYDAIGDRGTIDPHGTAIAGIIAASGAIRGVAPEAHVLSARVFRGSTSGSAYSTTDAVLKGINWAAERGARIINMSFAGPRDALVERHVWAMSKRGIVGIAAAGNNGPDAPPAYPAAYDDVIAVTAVDASDRLYDKANRGAYVAIAAPGVDVVVSSNGASHEFQSGTSFAAAHVSAVVALMLELDPAMTLASVRSILMAASDDLGAPGRDTEFGAGRLDAVRAVNQAKQAHTIRITKSSNLGDPANP